MESGCEFSPRERPIEGERSQTHLLAGFSMAIYRVGTGQFSELVYQFELPVLEVDQFSIRELVDQFSAENCQFELAVPPAVLRQSFNWSG
jgi:hypothetical protein